MDKICKTCKYHEDFSWVCTNGNSEWRADFTDNYDTCDHWVAREEPEQAQNAQKGV